MLEKGKRKEPRTLQEEFSGSMKKWKTPYKDTDYIECPCCFKWYPPDTELNQVFLEPSPQRYKYRLMCDACLRERTIDKGVFIPDYDSFLMEDK